MNRMLLIGCLIFLTLVGVGMLTSVKPSIAGHSGCGCHGYAPPPPCCGTHIPGTAIPVDGGPAPTPPNGSPSDTPKSGRLQGRWEIVSIAQDGEENRPGADERFTLTFGTDGQAVGFGGEDIKSKYRVNDRARPRQLDITLKDETYQAIYEIKGTSLRICFTPSDPSKRPTQFQAPKGGDTVLLTLRRGQQQSAKPALTSLVLNVPADAKVFLFGQATDRIGTQREFQTADLPVGKQWKNYAVRVEVRRQGQTLVQERKLTLAGGKRHELTVDFTQADVARARAK